MNNKMAIAGGAAILLAGILFIIFSSNDEIAQVISEVENEITKESSPNDLVATNTEDTVAASANAAGANGGAAMQESIPATNYVILGELEGGNIVTVSQASLLQDGYIVLYRINNRGESSLVGKSDLLKAGTHTNVSIQLVSVVAEMQAIVAVLHRDDGNGKFEYPGPDRYLLNDGLLTSDIDVVGIQRSDRESRVLETQVEAFLETNFRD